MRISPLRRARAAVRAGFTLIELLAVILIISILMTFLLPRIPVFIDKGEVTACQANLREIYAGLMIYKSKHNRAPNKSGVAFFGQLVSYKVWENSEQSGKKLTCPGVDISALEIGAIEDPKDWFSDLEVVDGSYSSYAGRDCKNHPLRKFPGKDSVALVADDNDPEMNHLTTTNVLYASGVVGTFEIAELIEDGTLGPEEEVLIVGPESPIEELQKLSLD